jgi:hypothetical protein
MMSHHKTVKKVQVAAKDLGEQADPENQPMEVQSSLNDVPPQDCEEGSGSSSRPLRSSIPRKLTNERAEFPR